jgi:hypothetical protein
MTFTTIPLRPAHAALQGAASASFLPLRLPEARELLLRRLARDLVRK